MRRSPRMAAVLAIVTALTTAAWGVDKEAPTQVRPVAQPQALAQAALKAGETSMNVACQKDPQFHYDLYVPKGYKSDEPTPLVFVFSPRGRVPLDLYRAAADKLGWLVCGSVESQNGLPWPEYGRIFSALLSEMKSRATVHPHRVYCSGMSGGSRVAMEMLRERPDIVTGVIGMAAAFGQDGQTAKVADGAAYVGIVGAQDYNYSEFVALAEQYFQQKVPYKIIEWKGPHDWAPAALIGQAMEWLDAQYYIRSPHLTEAEKPRRPKIVAEFLKQTAALGPTMEAYETYESLAGDFKAEADKNLSKQVADALAKMKPKLAAELEAREAFRAAARESSGPLRDEKSIIALMQRMKDLATKHASTFYGKRAETFAGALEFRLQMCRQYWQR